MRIFVTGASGWIGSAVVPELLGAGHEVVGLARSEASAERLEAAGAKVQRGDVDDPDGLAKAAADSDGVIHLAFQHEVAFGGQLRRGGRGRPAGGGGHGRRPGRLRPALRPRLGHARADRRPGGHRGRRAGAQPPRCGPTPPGAGRPRPCSPSRCGASASARRCCAFRRRSTATGTTASWPPSSASPASGACRATWVTAPTAGRPCTAPTPPGWPAWPSSPPPPARSSTPSATRASPSARSPRPSAVISTCRRRRCPPADAADHFILLGHFVGLDSPATRRRHPGAARMGADGPSLLEDLEQDHYYR